MSAFPDSDIRVQGRSRWEMTPAQFACVGTVLAILGLAGIWPALLSLWTMWTTDGLKSVGMVVPVVSAVLILRAWRSLNWAADGTWWGLPLLIVVMAVMWLRERAILILVISPHWSTVLPPPSLVLLVYGAGVVLLIGGPRLFRAALFPIVLLWFANPVPSRFSLYVDMPLQHASAHVARAFAIHLGHRLTPDNLRLMFTPDFGMFIAPGCDGIRGSVTMGFVALIAGYVYRFRRYANALVVAGGVLLGYVFNLARLCLLVLYYMIALHFATLQGKAEGADYVIGGMLFLVATLLMFAAIQRLRGTERFPMAEANIDRQAGETYEGSQRRRYFLLAALAGVVLLGWAGPARAHTGFLAPASAAGKTMEKFPERVGDYVRVRTWNEELSSGPVVYYWAQYALPDGGTPVAIGVSPVPDWHDPVLCHSVRGETPLLEGELTAVTAESDAVNFSSALYSDGVTQYLEVSTMCRAGVCGEIASERRHFGLIYTPLNSRSIMSEDPGSPVRILLHAETLDAAMPATAAREQLTQSLRRFLASVRLDDLARPYSR